jgi:hypothetical protein
MNIEMFYFGMSNEPDAIPAQMCGLWQLESTCTRAASELPLDLGSELTQVGRSVGVTVMEGDEEVEEKEGEQGPVSGGRPPARTVVGSNLGSTPIPSEASRVASSNGSRRRCCKPVGGAACRMDAIFARRLMQPPRPSQPVSYLVGVAHPPSRSRDAGDPGRCNLAPGYFLRDDSKMESRVLVNVVASHRAFEYLERSRRGISPLLPWGLQPSRSMLPVGQHTEYASCTAHR